MDPADEQLVESLRRALEHFPDDVPLRLHLARLLLDAGSPAETLEHCGAALTRDPGNAEALDLLRRASSELAGPRPTSAVTGGAGFDWQAAEEEVADLVEPAFVGDSGGGPGDDIDVERPAVTLADVGGMTEVKQRLQAAFLAPMQNPELGRLYGKSLSGGLLMWGPPGCGKTFLARAVAGELGAHFYAVSLADVLDMWIGTSERNVREIFDMARRNAPCVLFIDELDALGQKRTHLRHNSAMRGTVNQLLTEMDSVGSSNEGVFVLGATNHPWDVDAALIRPGRFDRMLLVLPPDAEARQAILRYHLRDRPVSGIDVARIAHQTEDFSGADLAHLCDSAAEIAMADSIASGEVRMIVMDDFAGALKQVKPSTGPWLATARNVALFSNESGQYDDLVHYLKRRRMA